jgi:hypothetical protein
MRQAHAADVLLVSLGSTEGLRRADDELQDSLRRAGASVAVARPYPPEQIPTLMLTDLVWARAAREEAVKLIDQQKRAPARSIIYSSTTAALLWPRPGAIRFDATSAGNRRGRHGLWQRPLERRRLRQAPLLLPWSEGGLDEAPSSARLADRTLVLPVPVEPSVPVGPASASQERDIAAITYAANPAKKGLDRVLGAWRQAITARGARVVGALPRADFRALLRRARVFVCAPRREDYGIAQLEALADGCQLVTTCAPGPYAALPIARELDPRLVGEDLAGALRVALEDPLSDYAERARLALEPFSREALDRRVAEQLLPRLLSQPL